MNLFFMLFTLIESKRILYLASGYLMSLYLSSLWMASFARAIFCRLVISLCCFTSWSMSFNPSSPGRCLYTLFIFNSASCVEERVGIVGNGYTLGPQSYPSSLRPNLRLDGPGIHGRTGLARDNTDCDVCVQYVLLDQGPEGSCF